MLHSLLKWESNDCSSWLTRSSCNENSLERQPHFFSFFLIRFFCFNSWHTICACKIFRLNKTYSICINCGHRYVRLQCFLVCVYVVSIGGGLVLAFGWLSREEAELWPRSSQLLMKTASQPSVKNKWHTASDSNLVSSEVPRLTTTGPCHHL